MAAFFLVSVSARWRGVRNPDNLTLLLPYSYLSASAG